MTLEDLGWTPSWLQVLASDHPHSIPGRITRLDRAQATVQTSSGEQRVTVPARLRRGEQRLVVGDWIAVDSSDPPRIDLLTRRTHLARRAAGRQVRRQLLAANIDVVFIVSSMDDDLSPRRLERYLTVVHEGGARPVIMLTKAGLVTDPERFVERARAVAPGVDVHAVDVIAGLGSEHLRAHVAPGTTAVLVGSSGVGKSTLLNYLAGREHMVTGAVRDRDGLGQHTTTHRELFVLPEGGVVIDTPGLRELALWADEDALDQAFADIDTLAASCRFRDCTHLREPGCAVREAVDAGTLDPSRLDGYFNLRAEIERTTAQRPAHERRKQERKFGRMVRQIQAHKRRRR